MIAPVLLHNITIPFPPSAVRYHTDGKNWWALASVNNEDYATPNCRLKWTARKIAFQGSYMFKVSRWQEID